MGNVVSFDCSGGCLEQTFSSTGEQEATQPALETRLVRLVTGSRFMKKAFLGLASKEVDAKLSEDFTCINWRTVSTGGWNPLTQQEKGIIDLTAVADVTCDGEQGLSLKGKDGSVVFAAAAETKAVRDTWVALLSELLQSWGSGGKRPEAKPDAENTDNKQKYFAQREAELEERARGREEKKKKYMGGGMKHTAMAMANMNT